ncbi:hypothetical protein LDENG_00295080 [Lucifuga dentata]|nr:hypothetical protein LDENG_00295080 [Lucifuga dentata]
MLQQLTTALQKQKGVIVTNGELSDVVSIPVQCTQENPVQLHEECQPQTVTTHNIAAHQCLGLLSKNAGTFSDLLAEDMSKLGMKTKEQRNQTKEDGKVEHKAPAFLAVDSSGWHGASSSVSQNPKQEPPVGNRTLQTARMQRTDSPSLLCEILNQPGGFLMSDVALQSHVCDFCEAVFPGDTTTRGEYLQHLYTHIT